MKLKFNNEDVITILSDDNSQELGQYSFKNGAGAILFIKCDRSYDSYWAEIHISFDDKLKRFKVEDNYMSEGEEYYLFEDMIVESYFMISNESIVPFRKEVIC